MLYWILRPLMWLFYKLFYPVKIYGKENLIKKGKCIVACNHLGKADVLVVGALYPDKTIFLSKKEWYTLCKCPIFSLALKGFLNSAKCSPKAKRFVKH